MSAKLSREELVELFWQSDAPRDLSKFCSGYVLHFYRELPAPPISYRPALDDELYDLSKTRPEQVTFLLDGRPFGEIMYLAVTCDGHVIVPPFPLSQRENLPHMKPAKEA